MKGAVPLKALQSVKLEVEITTEKQASLLRQGITYNSCKKFYVYGHGWCHDIKLINIQHNDKKMQNSA